MDTMALHQDLKTAVKIKMEKQNGMCSMLKQMPYSKLLANLIIVVEGRYT